MLDILQNVDEYNNAGALLGLDTTTGNSEVMSSLNQMNPVKRQRTINKLAGGGIPSRGSRAEMEKHFSELPQHIKDGLAKADLRLADTVVYAIKPVSSKVTKFFETQDTKKIALASLSAARLPKGSALLVSGITLLAGVGTDATDDKVMSIKFEGIENYGAISNGEFSLKSNKKIIMPETSNMVFKTNNNMMVPQGYYKLANPRLIHDDVLIEATVELGTMEGVANFTYLYLGLHGTITTP